jgi:hypothetical protein
VTKGIWQRARFLFRSSGQISGQETRARKLDFHAREAGRGLLQGAISLGEPTEHYGKWRIRWTDENGVRRSEVFATKDAAALALRRNALAVEERRNRRGAPFARLRRRRRAA